MIEMKNSGVDWIGEIPAHWEVKRFKAFAKTIKGKSYDTLNEPFDGSYKVLSVECLRQDEAQFYDYVFVDDENQICTSNDIVVIWDGAGVGEFLKAKDGVLSSTIAKIQLTNKSVILPYLWHWKYKIEYRLKSIPTGMGIPHLNPTLLNNFKIAIPPIEEQRAIADYLDEKTAEIDKQISLLEQKQNAYEKLKRSLINQVVTRGLNKDVPLKDSGIDWIGKIPAHWEIKRLKDVATSGSGTTPKSSNEKYYENGIYPWLITGDVQNKEIVSNDIFITELAVSEVPNLKLFPSKTVLLAMYGGGTIGNVGLMTYPAYINQACCALIPLKIIAEKYLFYYLLNKQERIISTGIGGTQINLSQNKIVAYPIAVPPIEEQRAIANYLDEKTAEIDEQISNIDKKINSYKRLKQSLIDEVVTGKRKI